MPKATKHSFLILLSFVLILIFAFTKDFTDTASATHEGNNLKHLSGFAWSSNIGWISFRNFNVPSATPYGVDVDLDNGGLLSGYAWSSNIGWISFGCGQDADNTCIDVDDPGFPSGTPSPFGPRLEPDGRLIGFARACSVFQVGCKGLLKDSLSLGGWDGWISLDGLTAGGEPYGAYLSSNNNGRFGGFAWGGGVEDDGLGGNISPQFPGWIDFSAGNTPPGPGPVFGGLIPSVPGVGPGGANDPGVRLCNDPFCGAEPTNNIACERNGFPIVNKPITWSITPADSNTYSYEWIVTPPTNDPVLVEGVDYIISGADTDSMTITYNTPGVGDWITVARVVNKNTGQVVLDNTCINGNNADISTYTVGDKGFRIKKKVLDASMTAQFIRSIRSVTFPDIALEIEPFGGFNEPTVEINFERILLGPDSSIKGLINPTNSALVVEPQFWKTATPNIISSTIVLNKTGDGPDGGIYEGVVLRLRLTKNQTTGADQFLPTSSQYQVIVDSVNGGSQLSIPLRINNPSGGVKEI
jgi:hypothetical protein